MNNVLEEICFLPVDSLAYKNIFQYEYNKNNNWITKYINSKDKYFNVVENKIKTSYY